MALFVSELIRYGIRALLAVVSIKILANIIEWLRVHWILSKLPQGPPCSNILLGNTGAASKVTQRQTFARCAELQHRHGPHIPSELPPHGAVSSGTWHILQDNHRWHALMDNGYGGIFPLRVMYQHLVHVSEPSLCLEVISSPDMDKEPFTYGAIATVRAITFGTCRHAWIAGKCVLWLFSCLD